MNEKLQHPAQTLRAQVEAFAGVSMSHCYQCGKCTAGCPLNEDMDLKPHQVLRILQAEMPGYEDRILRSEAIWLCLTCDMCYSRCPQEILLSRVMDFLRSESLRLHKVNPRSKDIVKFHQAFLQSVKKNGKLHELGLTLDYKMRSLHLLQDIAVAPKMLLRDKLAFFPHRVHNTSAIAKIFSKAGK